MHGVHNFMKTFVISIITFFSTIAVGEPLDNGKEECQNLFDAALPFSKQMLTEQGEFLPYGQAMQPNNKIVSVGAKIEGNERASSDELMDLLKTSFIEASKSKEYKATAIVYDVLINLPNKNEKSDAIAVDLDHERGYSVIVFIPYTISEGNLEFGEIFANKGHSAIFTAM